MLCQMQNKRRYDTSTNNIIKTNLLLSISLLVLLSSLIFSLCALNLNVACAEDDSNFSSSGVIKNIGEKKYKAIRITPEIYNALNYNLSDIMIYNESKNEAIPYLINSYSEAANTLVNKYDMRLVNSFLKDNYFYFDYRLARNKDSDRAGNKDKYGGMDSDILATSIELETKTINFAKRVELFGGYDNIHWERVADDTIYDVGGNKKLSITFKRPEKYTHYRFRLSNNLEKLEFEKVWLSYNETTKTQDYYVDEIKPEFSTDKRDKKTLIKIKGLQNIRIKSIEIQSDDMFKRTAYFANGKNKTIFNLSFNNTSYKDTLLEFDGYKNSNFNKSKENDFGDSNSNSDNNGIDINNDNNYLTITIDDKDDKAIAIKSIIVKYYFDEIIFDGGNGDASKNNNNNITLKFGNPAIVEPPKYDISNYKELILKEGYDVVLVDEVKTVVTEAQKQEYDYKLIFNVVVSIVAVVLGIIFLLKLKR